MCGLIAQLVEQRSGNAEVKGSNPVEALIFFRLLLSNCLKLETVRIYFLSEFSVCSKKKILLPWQRDVTTSPLYISKV